MVSEICIPTRERGNEDKKSAARRRRKKGGAASGLGGEKGAQKPRWVGGVMGDKKALAPVLWFPALRYELQLRKKLA